MKKFVLLTLGLSLLTFFSGTAQSLNLSITGSPTQLIQNGLIGAGVSVNNITGQVGTNAAATFTNNGIANFPFTNGILLTTGELTNINNPSSTFLSTSQSGPGDATLNGIVSPQQTYDAQVLTFEFAAAGDSMEFDFIFSSEEYNDYVNTPFNDVFGFFVTGPGYAPNTNVAIVPGTVSTPVSINNVNNGGPTAGPSTGPCVNCAYFIDNIAAPGFYPLAPDGFTTSINIRFPVQPCATYTFKIALADVSDGVFDSQVFMKQGSFTPCSTPRISASGTVVQNNTPVHVCYGDSVTLSLPDAPSYAWSNGDTTQSITVTQPGNYSAIINNGTCFVYTPAIEVVVGNSITPASIAFSNDTLFSNFNTPGYSFVWTLNGNPIVGSQNYIPVTGSGCYQLSVVDSFGCTAESNQWCTVSGIFNNDPLQVKLFPNPVSSSTFVTTNYKNGSSTTVKLFNDLGKLVKSITSPGAIQTEINVNDIADGIYFVEISNTDSTGKLKAKMIVNH